MRISIITPTYNCAKYIDQTIQSIRCQSYEDYEHIVVDGMSTDSTLKIVQKYQHIKLISEKDKGQSDALNKGFKIATGDIFAWQNADDVYSDEAFKIIIDFFLKNPKIDLVYGNYQLINEDGAFICDVHPPKWNKWLFIHGRFAPLQPTVFWRKNVYERIGDLDLSLHYCMDVDFFSRASKLFQFAYIPKFLGKFRVHKESKTQNKFNYNIVRKEYKSVLSRNFAYDRIDSIIFEIFQERKRLASFVKRNVFPKL